MHMTRMSADRSAEDWRNFEAFIGSGKTLGSVTKQDVERLKVNLKQRGHGNRTVNDVCVRIGAIYNRVTELGWYSRGNPFRGFKRLPTEKRPPRFLSTTEIDAVMEKAAEYGGDTHKVVALCLYAGLRSGEAANARWEWID